MYNLLYSIYIIVTAAYLYAAYLYVASELTMIYMIITIIYLIWIKSNQPETSEQIKFILNHKASTPERGTRLSAGYDLKASEECVVPARSHRAVKTGIRVVLPSNTYGRIASRSGLSFKKGIEVGAGVIDEDYQNEILVILYNHSDIDFMVYEEDRIAQFIVERVVYPETLIEDIDGNVNVTDSCIRSIRGLGGFGSTGLI